MKQDTRKHTIAIYLTLFVIIILAVSLVIQHRETTISLTLPEPPLKEYAQNHGISIGNFAIRNRIKEPAYDRILSSQFDLALIDNTPNWYFTDGGLRPSPDKYFFDHMDEVMSYAEENGMAVQAHHYLWGEEKWLPDWLKNGDYTPEQLDTMIKDHILTVGGRYKGKIREWTVVNEAFTRGQNVNGLRDWWADATGSKDYIDRAFIYARQADPDSVLILNDFGNEGINTVSDEMYDYIKDAKTRDIPIDAIGMQMHIDGRHPPTKDEVITNMNRFGEIGIDVYVTEFDVNMNDVLTDAEGKNAIQGDIYYEMARACIESSACKSFALLGITDKETWYNYIGLDDPRPLPFDVNYRPKPAFEKLLKAFSEAS